MANLEVYHSDSLYYNLDSPVIQLKQWIQENECTRTSKMQYWLAKNNYPWNESTCEKAAEYGLLDLLKWLHAHDCPWDERTATAAAGYGNIEILWWLHSKACPWDERTIAAASSHGHVTIVKWLCEEDCPRDTRACYVAAKNGDLALLEWLADHGCPWNTNTMGTAAKYGHLEIVQKLYSMGFNKLRHIIPSAVDGGCLQLLQWMSEQEGFYWDFDPANCAALKGDKKLLEWLREKGGLKGDKFSAETMLTAARGGYFTLVKWLREQGCPHPRFLMEDAVSSGNIDLIQYLHKTGEYTWGNSFKVALQLDPIRDLATQIIINRQNKESCQQESDSGVELLTNDYIQFMQSLKKHSDNPVDQIYKAAINTRNKILRWLRENGCPWDEITMSVAASASYTDNIVETIEWMHLEGCPWDSKTFTSAAEGHVLDDLDDPADGSIQNNRLRLLKWLHANGCPWDTYTIRGVADSHYLSPQIAKETVQWMHQKGCPWDEQTCAAAAGHGNLKLLMWLRKNGCPWDDFTLLRATRAGHIEIVQYLFKHNCPQGKALHIEALYMAAARKGYKTVVKFLNSAAQNCSWNEDAMRLAAFNGHSELVKWLYDNGCPWDSMVYEAAVQSGHRYLAKWMHEHGCPGLRLMPFSRSAPLPQSQLPIQQSSIQQSSISPNMIKAIELLLKEECFQQLVHKVESQAAAKNSDQ